MAKKKPSKEALETLAKIMAVSGHEKPGKPFHPAKYECDKCKTVIFSRYPGEFVQCKCGECYVDQTRYYARTSGAMTMIEVGKDDN